MIFLIILKQWVQDLLLLPIPHYVFDRRPDSSHHSLRRNTSSYRQRKDRARCIWLAFAVILFFFPLLPVLVGGSLLSTFLSFCLLDETSGS
ncbi:hypothetical protein QQM79_11565 [Marinobacteraceae bacterium S3BR75-40.1]